jgi:hypothetical protein
MSGQRQFDVPRHEAGLLMNPAKHGCRDAEKKKRNCGATGMLRGPGRFPVPQIGAVPTTRKAAATKQMPQEESSEAALPLVPLRTPREQDAAADHQEGGDDEGGYHQAKTTEEHH